jgi:hypothetical protein
MRSRRLLLFAAMLVPGAMAAQSDTTRVMVSGVVIDPLRQPIEGVELLVVGSATSAMSSKAGTFRFFIPANREVLIRVRRPGYRSQLLKVTGEWKGAVLLEPGVFELPEVQVTAYYAKPARYAGTYKYDDYFRRRRQGLGHFIDREEIEIRQPMYTSDLFTGRAGIKVTANIPGQTKKFTFARCNERQFSALNGRGGGATPRINVYVDGRKITLHRAEPGSGNGELLDLVDPHDIEMVEIFRGPGELPPEFNDGNCGAIVFWTRQGGR